MEKIAIERDRTLPLSAAEGRRGSIEYATGLAGALYLPPSAAGPAPGVLVLHGGAGVGDHEHARARRLAARGYVAYVPDLFGEVFASRERGVAVISALVAEPLRLRERVGAALAALAAQPAVDGARLAAIGFCFGGLAALELARGGAALRAVASFHGGLHTTAPAAVGAIRARVLACTGAADPFVSREQRAAFEDEMTSAGAAWELCVYGGAMHGFTEAAHAASARPGIAYHAGADRASWQALDALLADTFGT